MDVLNFKFLTWTLIILGLIASHANATDVSERLDELRNASCPATTEKFPFSPLEINASPVSLGEASDIADALSDNVKFIGGWHLTTQNSDFGGLSGLEILPNGDLLTVSDQGSFITIGMGEQSPEGSGSISPLLNEGGKSLRGKKDADAEGLAHHEGLVFVSFERNHRILAYDIANCEAAARGTKVTDLPKRLLGREVPSNNGAEALDIKDDKLIVGFEMKRKNEAPVLDIPLTQKNLKPSEPHNLSVPETFALVGLSKSSTLLRAYDPLQGNRNIIQIDNAEIEFTLKRPLTVDNFEGIVETTTEDGRRLIYIISDDNFSARQSTLLYAFELID